MSADTSESPVRVLICEDEQIVALDIRMHLESLGYVVPDMFGRAEDAVAFLEAARVDLVLMDIHLKGEMDGIEAAEIIRRRFETPVVMLTAYADEATLQRAKLSEPFAYLIKPFEERKLQTTLVVALHRHRMERTVRDRERLLSTVLGAIDNGVIVSDATGTIEYANERAMEILSVAVGDHVDAAFPATIRSNALDARTRFDTDSGDRGVRSLVVSGFPVSAKDSGQTVWAFRDETDDLEREQLLRDHERQLNRAERMEAVGRLSGGIAHDFNNLVTVIMGYTRLILTDIESGESSPEAMYQSVTEIHRTAKRSSELTRQLLAFSRNDVHNPVVVDANEALDEFFPVVRGALPDSVDLLFALRAEERLVRIDPHRLEQVILNLAINARDAMPGGGTLAVSTETIVVDVERPTFSGTLTAGTYVVIRVVDTGSGIDSEDLPHIFEPFYSTKDSDRGTGLGLASVFGIVEGSGGVVDVTSTVGHGSTFSIYLPIAEGGDAPEHQPAVSDAPRGSEVVLVVQEEETLRSMVVHTLRAHGYRTHSARNVGEAIIMAEHLDGVSLVLSDISAPFLSMEEVARRLSLAARGAAVLLTVDTPREIDGAAALLVKPFDGTELLTSVRAVTDAHLNRQ